MYRLYKYGLLAILAATLTGCSNSADVDFEDNSLDTREIEINVKGVKSLTRADFVESFSLPTDSSFSLYVMPENRDEFIENGANNKVSYINNKWTPANKMFFPLESERLQCFAFYPYDSNRSVFSSYIFASDQIDYLMGKSADGNGVAQYITRENPRADIYFEHIMSRITLYFMKEESDADSYSFPSAYVYSEDEGAYDRAEVSIWRQTVNPVKDNSVYMNATLTGNVLDDTHNSVRADFLFLPSDSVSWEIHVDNNLPSFTIPGRGYEAGYQYSYNVIITKNNTEEPEAISLEISDCQIKPWQDYPLGPTDVEAESAE